MPEAFDPTAWASALGVGGGWLVAVLLGLFVVRQLSTDRWVTRGQLDRARSDTAEWREIAREADERADEDRETTRALLAAANVSVRSVQVLTQQLPPTQQQGEAI